MRNGVKTGHRQMRNAVKTGHRQMRNTVKTGHRQMRNDMYYQQNLYKTHLCIGIQHNCIGWFKWFVQNPLVYRLTVGLHPHWLVQIRPSLICSKTFFFVIHSLIPLVGSYLLDYFVQNLHIYKGQLYIGWFQVEMLPTAYIEGLHPVWIKYCSKSICVCIYSTTTQVCSDQLNLFKPICVQVQPQ